MHFKSLLSLGLLVIASVSADKSSSRTACNKKKGYFLESPTEPNNNVYICLLPYNSNVDKGYCAYINGFDGCYERTLSNVNFCNKSSNEFNSRGCANVISNYSSMMYQEQQRHDNAYVNCFQKGGKFFHTKEPNDFRYACLLPESSVTVTRNKYCGSFGGYAGCYERTLSNISFCDGNSSEYNSRGCAMTLGYLYSDSNRAEQNRKQEHKSACSKKKGKFLENTDDVNDNRHACLVATSSLGNANQYICGSYGGFYSCYIPELSNIDYCDKSSKLLNGRGCAYALDFLEDIYKKHH